MGQKAAERITKSRLALSKVCLHTKYESKFADTTISTLTLHDTALM